MTFPINFNPGCTVNIGNAMNPKSGEFKVPEAGLYLFLVTCCTFDMKKCLLSIRKNGKDVANIFDQDGMENRVIFLFSCTVKMLSTLSFKLQKKKEQKFLFKYFDNKRMNSGCMYVVYFDQRLGAAHSKR